MYYKKYLEIPPLPQAIKQDLIKVATDNVENNIPCVAWFGRYETTNKQSIAFVEHNKQFEESNGLESGGVGFYSIPLDLHKQLVSFYQKLNHPDINFTHYWLQIVTGGNFVGPHVDDPTARTDGFLYILKSGGSNVQTTWYEIKTEFSHLIPENYTVIPYSKLNQIETHCLEEDMWHWLNFNKIHGVTNQESLRISLWGTYQ
jgi:hypothetical protein